MNKLHIKNETFASVFSFILFPQFVNLLFSLTLKQYFGPYRMLIYTKYAAVFK